MIFTSINFAFFLTTVVVICHLLPVAWRWIWILAAGIFFYMQASPVYIVVPFFITLVSWYAGLKVERSANTTKANRYYLGAILANVGLLVFFKYTNFFVASFFDLLNFSREDVADQRGNAAGNLLVDVIAPLGISYLTFQAIGYLIEIKRGNHPAEKNLGYFATYLLFFPKIIAGPVERAHHFLPQLRKKVRFDYDQFTHGLKLVLWGLFKKLVIADRISIYVDAVFGNASHHSAISLALAAILYVFQMYADFSGYTDMALGFAKLLGFDLVQNFNRPLLAKSVTEFWRKWHISLSTWFADYFYNPIAIAKRDWGKWSVVYAFFTTFIVLGFWHGANWTFIVFGALQGLILTIEFFTRKQRKELRKKIPSWLNNVLGTMFTVGYFAFSLIFFRAASVHDALTIIKRMFTAKGPLYLENPTIIIFAMAGIAYLSLVEFKKEYYNHLFTVANNRYWLVRNGYYCFLVLIILIAGVFDGGEFIYFQF
jgi:alginate O-acetyltransferase complex protein AlgI